MQRIFGRKYLAENSWQRIFDKGYMLDNIFQRMIVSEHLADTISRRFFDREKPESFPREQNHISFALIRAAALDRKSSCANDSLFSMAIHLAL